MSYLNWLFSEPLPPGTDAPDFTLSDQKGAQVSLAQYRGNKNVVLVFYPGDNTTICTKQLCEFRDEWALVEAKDAVVLGINPQNRASHLKFAEQQKYPFPLLVDEGKQVASLYRASGLIVKRTVYLIGKDGKIHYSQRGKPEPRVVLAAIAG